MNGCRVTALALACLALATPGMQAQAQAQSQPQDTAWQHASRAYEAFAAGDATAASREAARALALDPTPLTWHVLQVQSLIDSGQTGPALAAAHAALQRHPGHPALLMVRAHLLQAAGDRSAARADHESALRTHATPEGVLAAADAALSAGEPATALQWLQLLPVPPADAASRRAMALAQERSPGLAALRPPLPAQPPQLQCDGSANQPTCGIRYSHNLPFTLGSSAYALAERGEWPAVLVLTTALLEADPGNIRHHQLHANTLAALQQPEQAREAARQALRLPAFGTLPAVERAALANLAQDYPLQAQAYDEAEQTGTLPSASLQDAAYAAERVGQVAPAARRFRAVIDQVTAGQIALEPQKLQDVRVAVGALERTWGASVGLSSTGGSSIPGSFSTGGRERNAQFGTELFWRPQDWRGYGTHADLYVRTTGNLHAATGEHSGWPSVQLVLGARIKPLAEHNLVLAAERLVKAGTFTRNDWLVRAAYSATKGQLPPPHGRRWMAYDHYAEVGRYLDSGEEYAVAELRYGPNWRLGAEDARPASLWTHAVLALEHNNTYGRQNAASAGLGVNARWWLREDAYRAGRSWLELSLQYRARLGGDSRNSGWVLRATWNH